MKHPIIGLIAHYNSVEGLYAQKQAYVNALHQAKATPLLVPTETSLEDIPEIVARLDALLIPGGQDVDPAFYHAERSIYCGMSNLQNDRFELEIIKEAIKQKKPILGICRGMQLINVACGGTLYQDIESERETEVEHRVIPDDKNCYHIVKVEENSTLYKYLPYASMQVNSSHHQAVQKVAKGFTISAKCTDGIIEAIEQNQMDILAVQWHPERMNDDERMMQFFTNWVRHIQ